jgi:moderate conductance mechanosensitive channel
MLTLGVKIFRCKFETAPGKQFDVRAQAYKRIEAALKSVGIVFADGRQTVFIRQTSDAVDVPGAGSA